MSDSFYHITEFSKLNKKKGLKCRGLPILPWFGIFALDDMM